MVRENNFEVELFHEFINEVVERQRARIARLMTKIDTLPSFDQQLLTDLEEMSAINLFQCSIDELEKLNFYWHAMNDLTKKIVESEFNES